VSSSGSWRRVPQPQVGPRGTSALYWTTQLLVVSSSSTGIVSHPGRSYYLCLGLSWTLPGGHCAPSQHPLHDTTRLHPLSRTHPQPHRRNSGALASSSPVSFHSYQTQAYISAPSSPVVEWSEHLLGKPSCRTRVSSDWERTTTRASSPREITRELGSVSSTLFFFLFSNLSSCISLFFEPESPLAFTSYGFVPPVSLFMPARLSLSAARLALAIPLCCAESWYKYQWLVLPSSCFGESFLRRTSDTHSV
jgi:hypothetical protein